MPGRRLTCMARLRGAAALAAAMIGAMAFAGSANAATMRYVEGDRYFPAQLIFTSSPGEATHLQVTTGPAPRSGAPSIYYRDPVNLIVPDTGQDEVALQQ